MSEGFLGSIRRLRNVQFSTNPKAAAGSAQADAAVLTHTVTNVTGASGTNGVIIPPVATQQGSGTYVVINANGANALLVYPPVGAAFNGGTLNANFSIAANKIGIFFIGTATNIGAITA